MGIHFEFPIEIQLQSTGLLNDLVHIKFFQPAMDKVLRSSYVPVNVTAIRALNVVICVFALGHDPVIADALFAPRKLILDE